MSTLPPRGGFDRKGRLETRTFVLDQLGEDPRLSRGAIERYPYAAVVAAKLRRAWAAEPWTIRTGPPGGLHVNPLARMIAKAER